ncbi:spermidine synthase [Bacillus cereus]|uniref:spermidine synthase n=1 Tax=Bacillus cereus TaxID=1396 RepID=UPI000B4AC9E6|nr:fused MFS/spermidine synthase [Bacillus cereus]WJX08337.1 fused MFS/spermidine synthase [Bacillus cereus]
MIYPCIKCYKYSDDILEISIGDYHIKERICKHCKNDMTQDIEKLIMDWTLQFYNEEIIHKIHSKYNKIYVTENADLRFMRFFTALQSGLYKDSQETPAYYLYSFLFGPIILNRQIKNILCVGLGSGYLAKLFRRFHQNCNIDIVEIDEEVYSVSQKYFAFKADDKMNIYIMDAVNYFKECPNEQYDLVILDAYDGPKIPDHINQINVYKNIKRMLKPDGLLLSNLFGRVEGEASQEIKQTVKKLSNVFAQNVLIPSSNDWEINILSISGDNFSTDMLHSNKLSANKELYPLLDRWAHNKIYS